MEKYPYMQDDDNMKLHTSTNNKTGKQLKEHKINYETVLPKINTTHLQANQIHKKSTIHKKIKLIIELNCDLLHGFQSLNNIREAAPRNKNATKVLHELHENITARPISKLALHTTQNMEKTCED